jgi:hypothetical protein
MITAAIVLTTWGCFLIAYGCTLTEGSSSTLLTLLTLFLGSIFMAVGLRLLAMASADLAREKR